MKIKDFELPHCMMPDGADPCGTYQKLWAHALEMEQRIAALEAIIAAAPHSDSCCLEYVTVGAVDRDETRPYCNCWKSKAGEQAHG